MKKFFASWKFEREESAFEKLSTPKVGSSTGSSAKAKVKTAAQASTAFAYDAEAPQKEHEAGTLITRLSEHLVEEIQQVLKMAKEGTPTCSPPACPPAPWARRLCALLDGTDRSIPVHKGALSQPGDDEFQDIFGTLMSLSETLPPKKLAKRCLNAGLVPALVHCLRLMRVAELDIANYSAKSECPTSPISDKSDDAKDPSDKVACPRPEQSFSSVAAAQRVAGLLEQICRGEGGSVGENLRQHLMGLILLAVSAYPAHALHLQQQVVKVIKAISEYSLTPAVVWFLHDKKLGQSIMRDLMDLVGFNPDCLDSPSHISGVLYGLQAEEVGAWITALDAITFFVRQCSKFEGCILQDLVQAGLYEVLLFMLEHAQSQERLTVSLTHLISLVTTGKNKARTSASGSAISDKTSEDCRAKNMDAFSVIPKLLFNTTPFLKITVESIEKKSLQSSELILLIAQNAAGKLTVFQPILEKGASKRRFKIVLTPHDFRIHMLHSVLQLYTQHPENYNTLEKKYHVLSFYIGCLLSFKSLELKQLIMKTLELICTGVISEVPAEILHATCIVFKVCCEEMLSVMMNDVMTPFKTQHQDSFGSQEHADVEPKETDEDDPVKIDPSTLLEDAHLICNTLVKLLPLDHKYTQFLVKIGFLDEIMIPLLVKTLSACEGLLASSSPVRLWDSDKNVSFEEQESSLQVFAHLSPPATPPGCCRIEGYRLADHTCVFLCSLLEQMSKEEEGAVEMRRLEVPSLLYAAGEKLGPNSSRAALSVLLQCFFTGRAELLKDIEFLVDLIHKCRAERWRQSAVLLCLRELLKQHEDARDLFRQANGFQALIGILATLDAVFDSHGSPQQNCHNEPSAEQIFQVIRACIECLIASLGPGPEGGDPFKGHPQNRVYFREEIQYDVLTSCIRNSGVLNSELYSEKFIDLIFMLLTGVSEKDKNAKHSICNPDAIHIFINILPEIHPSLAVKALGHLNSIVLNATPGELEHLVEVKALSRMSNDFVQHWASFGDALREDILRLIFKLAEHRTQVTDFSYLLRCVTYPIIQEELIKKTSVQSKDESSSETPISNSLHINWKQMGIMQHVAEIGSSVPYFVLGGGDGNSLQQKIKQAAWRGKHSSSFKQEVYSYPKQFSDHDIRFIKIPLAEPNEMSMYPPWPPNNGYAFSCWFMHDVPINETTDGSQNAVIWLVTFCTLDQRAFHHVYLDLTQRQVHFQTHHPKYNHVCIRVHHEHLLRENVWHHFVICRRKDKRFLTSSERMVVYLDGEQVDGCESDPVSFTPTAMNCLIGIPPLLSLVPRVEGSDEGIQLVTPLWKCGPCLLISEVLELVQVQGIYYAGPEYTGCFFGRRPIFQTASALMTSVLRHINALKIDINAALEDKGLKNLEVKWQHRLKCSWKSQLELGKTVNDLTDIIPKLMPEQILFACSSRNISGSQYYLYGMNDTGSTNSKCMFNVGQEHGGPTASLHGEHLFVKPMCVSFNIFAAGGVPILLPLLQAAASPQTVCLILRLLDSVIRGCTANVVYMQSGGGYHLVGHLLRSKRHILDESVLAACLRMGVDGLETEKEMDFSSSPNAVVTDPWGLKHLVLSLHIWNFFQRRSLLLKLLRVFRSLTSYSNKTRDFNLRCFQGINIAQWILHLVFEVGKGAVDDLRPIHADAAKDLAEELLIECTTLLMFTFEKAMDASVLRQISQISLSTLFHSQKLSECCQEGVDADTTKTNMPPHARTRLHLLRMILSLMKIQYTRENPKSPVRHSRLKSPVKALASSFVFIEECHDSDVFLQFLKPNWFECMLHWCRDEGCIKVVLCILRAMLQESGSFKATFEAQGGFKLFSESIPRYSSSSAVIFFLLAILFQVPICVLPLTDEPELEAVELSSMWRFFELSHQPTLNEVEFSEPILEILMSCIFRNFKLQRSSSSSSVVAQARTANTLVLTLLLKAQVELSFWRCLMHPLFIKDLLWALFKCLFEGGFMKERENAFMHFAEEWWMVKPNVLGFSSFVSCGNISELEILMFMGMISKATSDIVKAENTVIHLRCLFGILPQCTEPPKLFDLQDGLLKLLQNSMHEELLRNLDHEKASKLAPICLFLVDLVYMQLVSAAGSVLALQVVLDIAEQVCSSDFHTLLGSARQSRVLSEIVPASQILLVQVSQRCISSSYQLGINTIVDILSSKMFLFSQPYKTPLGNTIPQLYTNPKILTDGLQVQDALFYFNEARRLAMHLDPVLPESPAPLLSNIVFEELTVYFMNGIVADLVPLLVSEDINLRLKMLLVLEGLIRWHIPSLMESVTAPKERIDLYPGGLDRLEPGKPAQMALRQVIPERLRDNLNEIAMLNAAEVVNSCEVAQQLLVWADNHRRQILEVSKEAKEKTRQLIALNSAAAGMRLIKEIQKDRFNPAGIERTDHIVRVAHDTWTTAHYIWQKKDVEDLAWCTREWKHVLCGLSPDISIWGLAGALEQTLPRKVLWMLDLTEGPERLRRRFKKNTNFLKIYKVAELVLNEEVDGRSASPDPNSTAPNLPDEIVQNDEKSKLANTVDLLSALTGFAKKLKNKVPDSTADSDEEFDELEENFESSISDAPISQGLDEDELEPPEDAEETTVIEHCSELTLSEKGQDSTKSLSDFEEKEETAEERENSRTEKPVNQGVECSDGDLLLGLIAETDLPLLDCCNVKRCMGLEVNEALFLLCKKAVYIVGGFEKKGDRPGLEGVQLRPKSETSPVSSQFSIRLRPPAFTGNNVSTKVVLDNPSEGFSALFQDWTRFQNDQADPSLIPELHCAHIPFSNLLVVFKRRYQLQQTALEFFDDEGRTFMIVFESEKKQCQVLSSILSSKLPKCLFFTPGFQIQMRRPQARSNYRYLVNQLKFSMTRQWQQGKLTNFEYLMALNSFAGRTFNDLTQYPVFPWVLADYDSKKLDLEDEKIYRDLSKPMGAIGQARARQFLERYEAQASMASDGNSPPAFHYGTHYSCAGYVLTYLVRMEPFTKLSLTLQGGNFDKADRLFRDIKASWESASQENIQDVRELIPEFFYLPEFLVNSNGFDLGITQKGDVVYDVKLPAWANNDPRQFIRIHRKALESQYVSRNLHQWIDLIFGYKQKGREAEKAQNVFVHITYEDEVDLNSLEDPLLREATIAQINNFGQTPSRLFKRPHPAKKPPALVRLGVDNLLTIDPSAVAWYEHQSPPLCLIGVPNIVGLVRVAETNPTGIPVGDVWLQKDRIHGVGHHCILRPPNPTSYIRYGKNSNGFSFHITNIMPTGSIYRENNKLIRAYDDLHLSPVTCLAISTCGNIVATGSSDSTVKVWSLSDAKSPDLVLRATFCGHESSITCVDVCSHTGSVVSGGQDKRAILWDLRRNSFLRKLGNHKGPLQSVSINKTTGDIVTLGGGELRLYTVTGDLLAFSTSMRKEMPSTAISANCPYWQDGVVAVVGHKNGIVTLWKIAHEEYHQIMEHEGITISRINELDPLNEDSQFTNTIPTCFSSPKKMQLERELTSVHNSEITCLKFLSGQEILVGDFDGKISRWVCTRIDQLLPEEQHELLMSS